MTYFIQVTATSGYSRLINIASIECVEEVGFGGNTNIILRNGSLTVRESYDAIRKQLDQKREDV